VLAWAYQQHTSGEVTIRIYDPNLPGRDDVVIRTEPVLVGEPIAASGAETVAGLKSTELVGETFYKEVRGFFEMPYSPVWPPKGL
jgi:hypothetical protein